jgi:hypothetical protein
MLAWSADRPSGRSSTLEDGMTDPLAAANAVDGTEAARILGVDLDQFDAMVEEGLISPLPGRDERRFDANEVRSLRVQDR